MPEALVMECLQRLTDWCLKYTRDEDRRGGLPPIPSAASFNSEWDLMLLLQYQPCNQITMPFCAVKQQPV